MFWERFEKLCKAYKTTANEVCAKIGKSNATATHWKNGSIPNGEALVRVSDYFGVSVDYLLGREEDFLSPDVEIAFSDCIIAYIDILGTSSILEETPENYLQIISTVYSSTKNIIAKMNSDNLFGTDTVLKHRSFSDNIVFAIEYSKETLLEKTFYMIEFISLFQFLLTKKHIFIRGGICYGKIHINSLYVTGEGLVKAYNLESKNAFYPRVIVEKDLASKIFLKNKETTADQNASLIVDSDNYSFLNYLKYANENRDIQEHYNFLANNAIKCNDEKKKQKNDWAILYHNSFCLNNNYNDFLFQDIQSLAQNDVSDKSINTYDNHGINYGIIGHANAPVTITNTTEKLSEQETALLELFKKFDVVKQAQLLAYAAELEKEV